MLQNVPNKILDITFNNQETQRIEGISANSCMVVVIVGES